MANEINSSALICRDVQINSSSVGIKAVVGDLSRLNNSRVGDYCSIDRQNFVLNSKVGDYSYTGPWCMIFHCSIGKFCSISYGVTIGPPEHNYRLLSTHPFIYRSKYDFFGDDQAIQQQRFEKEINIGNDVWCGCNSVIARGVNVGDGAVIGANSFVNKDVPPYAIVAGSPAKIIKYRFREDIVNELVKIKWWDLPKNKIQQCKKFFLQEVDVESLNKFKQEMFK